MKKNLLCSIDDSGGIKKKKILFEPFFSQTQKNLSFFLFLLVYFFLGYCLFNPVIFVDTTIDKNDDYFLLFKKKLIKKEKEIKESKDLPIFLDKATNKKKEFICVRYSKKYLTQNIVPASIIKRNKKYKNKYIFTYEKNRPVIVYNNHVIKTNISVLEKYKKDKDIYIVLEKD